MNEITLAPIVKSPAERIRVPVDFGNVPALVDGASGGAPAPLVLAVTVSSHSVVCSGGSGHPTVSGERLDYPYQLSALFTGGTAGEYTVVYTIVLSDADQTTITATGTLTVT